MSSQKSISVNIVSIKQVCEDTIEYKSHIYCAGDVVYMVRSFFDDLDREVVAVVGLNTKNIPNVVNVVSVGTANRCSLCPRDIFKALILSNAVSFILLHNHPSGDLEPSDKDKDITKKVYQLGDMMEIELLDHLIIGLNGEYRSFKEYGISFE